MRTSEMLGTKDLGIIVKFVAYFVGFNTLECAKSDVVDIIEHGEWDGQDLVYASNQNRACYRAAGEENGCWFDADSIEDARHQVDTDTYAETGDNYGI